MKSIKILYETYQNFIQNIIFLGGGGVVRREKEIFILNTHLNVLLFLRRL